MEDNKETIIQQGWITIRNTSNIILQILLFVDLHFSIISHVAYGYTIYTTITKLEKTELILMLLAYCVASPSDYFRLFLGYKGNLKENVKQAPSDQFVLLINLISFRE